MPMQTLDPSPPVEAGEFSTWLAAFGTALRGSGGSEVPCGDCTGCCTSGYSLQIRPADSAALARIPAGLLLEVEGFGTGERTLPASPDGRCRMLEGGRCGIYVARPQTCLDYDCRVFAAAGIDAGGEDKAAINRRVRAWRFSYADEAARQAHAAVREAARFLRTRRDAFEAIGARVPGGPMGIAVFAVKAHAALLRAPCRTDASATARELVEAARRFDATR